jgi:hybrid polyketide synthase/nonribosomal peptide synthetase ACE1
MIAVASSFQEAMEICESKDFHGRLTVAAVNSPESITISGDIDAVEEVKLRFEEEETFVRVLTVDTAYHSHHMLPCSSPYIRSLQEYNLQILQPIEYAPIWYSSVDIGNRMKVGAALKDRYWADNMVKPVLFAQAVEYALKECTRFGIALEIGPHPALKSPVTQTIKHVGGETVPYFGTLFRGKDDFSASSDTLGSIWSHLGASAVNFTKFHTSHYDVSEKPSLLKGLPTYTWNHEREYWSE